MRNVLSRIFLIVALCVTACAVAAAQSREVRTRTVEQSQADAESPLTNVSVIKLARAKFSDKMIVAIIRTRAAKFDLSPDRLIELKKNGVSERVILAMLERDGASQLAGAQEIGDADDDAFFDGLNGARRKPDAGAQTGGNNPSASNPSASNPSASNPNEVDIFGSSGGARGETRTNGVNGGVSGETQTTGSATVHIIRPQEQTGASAKLERTPTLTNQSIVDLIEAGFSEGTIIRRIENSPADFDLSPAKLAELRKRRVTEPVISAMRAAMSDDVHASSMSAQPHNQR